MSGRATSTRALFAHADAYVRHRAIRAGLISTGKQRVANSIPAPRSPLRHTFVSLLSAHGVPVEAIALLAGHNHTATTELVYRHQIVPALTRGAEVMDRIFG